MSRLVSLSCVVCIALVCVSAAVAAPIHPDEVKEQNEIYQRWWETDLEWRFEKLPASSQVEENRMPWAGYIYPDRAGGCTNVLRKYDWAFNGRRGLASGFERQDIEEHKEETTRRAGLLGLRTRWVNETPDWAGHCNGWTAAAIRHAEPENNVTRNGVVFRPSDIKGLLAELYVYSSIETLGGVNESAVNPGTLHVVLGNWLGLGKHTIGMDNTLGKEVWNYPIYSYKSTSARRGNFVDVRTNIGFVGNLDREYDRAPRSLKYMSLSYRLELDDEGKIIGGVYYRGSSRLDLLWVPLQPVQGGEEGHEDGNPHLKAKEVLALWRDSVPAEKRNQWYNINPTSEDAIVDDEGEQE